MTIYIKLDPFIIQYILDLLLFHHIFIDFSRHFVVLAEVVKLHYKTLQEVEPHEFIF